LCGRGSTDASEKLEKTRNLSTMRSEVLEPRSQFNASLDTAVSVAATGSSVIIISGEHPDGAYTALTMRLQVMRF